MTTNVTNSLSRKATLSQANMHTLLTYYVGGFSTNKRAAQALDISPQYLTDVLMHRREISGRLALKMGYKRELSFKRMP